MSDEISVHVIFEGELAAEANGTAGAPGASVAVEKPIQHRHEDIRRRPTSSATPYVSYVPGPPISRTTSRLSLAALRTLRRAVSQQMRPGRPVGQAPTLIQGLRFIFASSWLNMFLIFLPISWVLHFTIRNRPALVFSCLYLAVIPLGNLIGLFTDEITLRLGPAPGLWVSTTMGNSVELASAIIAIRQCQLRVVQSSLVGAMLSNLLFVLGICFVAGGTRFSQQGLSYAMAQINASLLALAVIAVILPAAFHFSVTQSGLESPGLLTDSAQGRAILGMSHGASIVLLSLYLCFLVLQLWSHVAVYGDGLDNEDKIKSRKYIRANDTIQHAHDSTPPPTVPSDAQGRQTGSSQLEMDEKEESEDEDETPQLSLMMGIVLLIIVIALTVVTLEWLVGTLDNLAAPGHISKEWIGLILLPLLSGNTAERIKSVTSSVRDKLDHSVKAAVGSTIQIAVFIIPLVVCLAWMMKKPLTLLFDPFEYVALFLSVLTLNYITQDGVTTWFEGMILIHLYLLVAVTFWFYPGSDPAGMLLQCH